MISIAIVGSLVEVVEKFVPNLESKLWRPLFTLLIQGWSKEWAA